MLNTGFFEKFFSAHRYGKYLIACDGDRVKAADLYTFNLTLTRGYYPLLSIFEVALRNRANEVLNQYFGNDFDWIFNQAQPSGFMNDPSLGRTFLMKRQVEAAIESLRRKQMNVQAQIIAELTLSFWIRLFQADHFRLLNAVPMNCFQYLPKGTKRETIHGAMKDILEFRNRIYHNEPVCFGTDKRTNRAVIDLTIPQNTFENIHSVLFWMGGNELTNWAFKGVDNQAIDTEARKLNRIIESVGFGKTFSMLNSP